MATNFVVGRHPSVLFGLCSLVIAGQLAACGGEVSGYSEAMPEFGQTIGAMTYPCPDCPELSPEVIVDTIQDEMTLEIDPFTDFDYHGTDAMELYVKEGSLDETIDLTSLPSDVEAGISESGLALPSGMTGGSGFEAKVIFFDSSNPSTRTEVSASVTLNP